MFRAGLIAVIIIFLQISTFAATNNGCRWQDTSSSFFKNLSAQSSSLQCRTVEVNEDTKKATISCSNLATYFVFFSDDSIYMQTLSNIRQHILTKCWREGIINSACETTVSGLKCQSYDLDTY